MQLVADEWLPVIKDGHARVQADLSHYHKYGNYVWQSKRIAFQLNWAGALKSIAIFITIAFIAMKAGPIL